MKLIYLDILCESIENLFCNLYGFGKISLSLLINNIFPRIIPIEITNRFLKNSCEKQKEIMQSNWTVTNQDTSLDHILVLKII